MKIGSETCVAGLAALASCGAQPAEQAAAPEPTVEGPRELVSVDFADLELGPKIVGPQGPEVVSPLTDADGNVIAQMTSYVACPAEVRGDVCKPATQWPDTVYTYVHTIVLGEDIEAPDPSSAQRLVTMRPATGFNGLIGYDEASIATSLGDEGSLEVGSDGGALVWRVRSGNGLSAGETVTLFWQSTLPPEGPAAAYRLVIGGKEYVGTGPFPAAEAPQPPNRGAKTGRVTKAGASDPSASTLGSDHDAFPAMAG